jgi:glycosyltransferase involved in cell wall biosynthesis
MRILIGSDTYYPQIDGTSYFTQRLATGLAARGHEVNVVCPADPALTGLPDHQAVSVHTVPSFMTPFHPTQRVCLPAAIRRPAARAVRTIKPDVVHVQGHFPLCRTLMLAAREQSIPVVATNHFMPENLVPYYFFPRWARGFVGAWAWRDVARWFAYPQVITTPTDIAADVLRTHGVDRPVTVISGGVDTRRFSPGDGGRAAARRMLGLPDKPTILYVGRLSADKAVTDLIDALPQISRDVDAHLVIAGRGVKMAALRRRCQDVQVADRTHFLGFIPNEDIVRVYQAADVFCMPGRAELQSLATLEALSCGLPAVAAHATALPHLVRDGVNGFLYQPGDIAQLAVSLRRVLADPAASADMGRASREIALAHDADLTISQYEETYRQAQAR